MSDTAILKLTPEEIIKRLGKKMAAEFTEFLDKIVKPS